ncbi:MAG: universal stress protein [Methanosphaera sp.]
MYKKILLPTDGSKNSYKAIKHAYEIAKDEDAEILVLNVVDSKHLTSLPEDALTDEALSVFEKQSEVVTERVVKQIEDIDSDFATKVSTLSVEGNPVDAILKVSEKKDIDLIVIASSGKHMLDRFLLGSVTEKTIRYSKVPVLVIPTTEK